MIKNMGPHKRNVLSLLIIIGSYALSTSLISFGSKSDSRLVNPKVIEMINSAKDGDLLFVDSNDFVSGMFKDLDSCSFSSYKIVFKESGKSQLLISDLDNLSDNTQGLYTMGAIDYFKYYNDVRIALYRPKTYTEKNMQTLKELINMSRKIFVDYDLTFDNEDRTTMTCEKIILEVHGEDAFIRDNESRPPYWTTLPCDINLEQFTKIHDWISFWQG